MGTDMWCVVGRVKPNTDNKAPGTELAVFGDKRVSFEDLEFYSGKETNLSRSYKLYYFLGDNDHWLNPNNPSLSVLPNLTERQIATEAFIDWINGEYEKSSIQFKNKYGNYGPFMGNDIDECLHFIGDRCHTLHRVEDLRKFDYGQQEPIEGKTYRELFPSWWFQFLDWCKEQKWEFAIFGFSY